MTRWFATGRMIAAGTLLPALLLFAGCGDMGDVPTGPGTNGGDQNTLTWVDHIRPNVVQPNCSACHGGALARNGLDLGEFDEWIDAESSYGNPYVVPGEPDSSEIVWRLEGTGGLLQMPQGGELPPDQIDRVRAWIEQGAVKE